MKIKRTYILLLLAVGAFSFFLGTILFANKPSKDTPEPDTKTITTFEITDTSGRTLNLEQLNGQNKLILINLWASWCAPCIEEFPRLLDLAEAYKDNLVFIALSSDIEQTDMQKFLEKQQITSKDNRYIALDKASHITTNIFKAKGLPNTYLIDPELKIRYHLKGGKWETETLENQIKMLLGSIENAS